MPIHADRRLVKSTGPVASPLWCIGEAPGQEEHYRGYSFVGKSGQILDQHLAWHGCPRYKTFVWNLVHYWPGEGNPDPDAADIARDSPKLLSLIQAYKPKVIAGIGRISSAWLLDRPVVMERDHGLVQWSDKVGCYIVVCYHPAAGFHRLPDAEKGWWDLKVACETVRNLPREPVVWKPREASYIASDKTELAAKLVSSPVPLAIDTEGSVADPWGLSYCRLGSNRPSVIRYPATQGLMIDAPSYIFHYAPHDLKILEALGVSLRPGARVHDTMSRAYVLQTEPQALKNLVYRHLGITTPEYQDVVAPHYLDAVEEWVHHARSCQVDWPEPKRRLMFDEKKGKYRVSRPHTIPTRLKALHNSILRSKVEMDDLRDRLTEWDQLPDVERLTSPVPKPSLSLVPLDLAVRYSGGDAYFTAAVWPILENLCVAAGVERAYQLDSRVIPTIRRIERNGIALDRAATIQLRSELTAELKKRLITLQSQVGPHFNPGSPDQVKDYLFTRLRMFTRRRSKKTGAQSADERALQTIRASLIAKGQPDHPAVRFIDDLLAYREVQKLRSTYAVSYLRARRLSPDRRLRARIKYTRSYTGRWAAGKESATASTSGDDLNLLNIPKRSEMGRRIRGCFVARPGYVLLSCDLSQIELRMMAHCARERKMIDALTARTDLHALTATGIFGTSEGSARDAGKTLNFAIMYGIQAASLYDQLRMVGVSKSPYDPTRDLSIADCDRMIAAWFQLYSSVRNFMALQSGLSRKHGIVRTSSGRMRILPYARWDAFPSMQAESDRQAGNHPIQGDANEHLKEVMARLEEQGHLHRWEKSGAAYLLLQIHDELLFEVKDDSSIRLAIARVIRDMMISVGHYLVPIDAEAKFGTRWAGMEKVEFPKEAA